MRNEGLSREHGKGLDIPPPSSTGTGLARFSVIQRCVHAVPAFYVVDSSPWLLIALRS